MQLYERIAHVSIGSPFQDLLEHIRELSAWPHLWKNPGLKAVYAEGRYIKQLIQRQVKDGMNCLDIGAHIGSILELFHQVSPQGQHIAFEALPYKSQWLQKKYPQAQIHSMALSDIRGTTEFHYNAKKSGFSGLRQHQADSVEESTSLTVTVAPLDEVIPVSHRVDFIKLDVEGAELKVLRGGLQTIQRCQPTVLFECTRSGLDLFEAAATDMYRFFEQQLSYQIFVIPDYLAGEGPLSLSAFDAAMAYPFRAFNFVAVPRSVS